MGYGLLALLRRGRETERETGEAACCSPERKGREREEESTGLERERERERERETYKQRQTDSGERRYWTACSPQTDSETDTSDRETEMKSIYPCTNSPERNALSQCCACDCECGHHTRHEQTDYLALLIVGFTEVNGAEQRNEQ